MTGTHASRAAKGNESPTATPAARQHSPAAEAEPPAAGTRLGARAGQAPLRPSRVPASSGGECLTARDQAHFERRLGQPLGDVRLHTDPAAQQSASRLGLRAYALGSDIYFGPADHDAATRDGHVLAHEIAHVAQQSARTGPEVSGTEAERNADEIAGALLSGTSVPRPSRAGHSIQGLPLAQTAPPLPLDKNPISPEDAAAVKITAADRHTIELGTVTELAAAADAFSVATVAHANAIKNEAKAEAEIIAAVVDVATGFLAPVFANWAVGKLTAQAAALQVGKETKYFFEKLISKQDLFKAAFTGAMKTANQAMKTSANALFGETEIDAFAKLLRNAFRDGIVAIGNEVGSMPADQLLAVWVAFNPANANEDAYRQVLGGVFKRYQQQVEPIGRTTLPVAPGAPGSSSDLVQIQLSTHKRLANVTFWDTGEKDLWAWISPDMENIARAKARGLGLDVLTIPLNDVEIKLGDMLGRPDLRQKDMLEIAYALKPDERQRAAADPDVVAIIETKREIDGRIPNQYERHKTLFVLRGFSSHAIACLDELDSWIVSGAVVDRHLKAMDAAERRRLAQDSWFVGRLHAELSGYELEEVLFTLGLGPAPKPSPSPYTMPLPPPGIPWW